MRRLVLLFSLVLRVCTTTTTSSLTAPLSVELDDTLYFDGSIAATANASAWSLAGGISSCNSGGSFSATVSGVPYTTPQLYFHGFPFASIVYAGVQVVRVDFFVTRMLGTEYSLSYDASAVTADDKAVFGYAPNGLSGTPQTPSNGTTQWEPLPDTIAYRDLWNGMVLDGSVVADTRFGVKLSVTRVSGVLTPPVVFCAFMQITYESVSNDAPTAPPLPTLAPLTLPPPTPPTSLVANMPSMAPLPTSLATNDSNAVAKTMIMNAQSPKKALPTYALALIGVAALLLVICLLYILGVGCLPKQQQAQRDVETQNQIDDLVAEIEAKHPDVDVEDLLREIEELDSKVAETGTSKGQAPAYDSLSALRRVNTSDVRKLEEILISEQTKQSQQKQYLKLPLRGALRPSANTRARAPTTTNRARAATLAPAIAAAMHSTTRSKPLDAGAGAGALTRLDVLPTTPTQPIAVVGRSAEAATALAEKPVLQRSVAAAALATSPSMYGLMPQARSMLPGIASELANGATSDVDASYGELQLAPEGYDVGDVGDVGGSLLMERALDADENRIVKSTSSSSSVGRPKRRKSTAKKIALSSSLY